MNDLNHLSISGRLTRDIDLKSTSNGATFVRASIASNHSKKKSDGTWEEVPGFFDFVCWKHTAEYLHKYAKKGDTLIIAGSLRWQSWETTAGEKRSKVEVSADQIIIKPKRGDSQPEPEEPAGSGGAAHYDTPNTADDDIPF